MCCAVVLLMGVAPRIPGGKMVLTKLKTVTFSLSRSTTTSVTCDLSAYNVANKKTSDFVALISTIGVSAAYTESRNLTSLKISDFTGSVLTLLATHDAYDYHGVNITLAVDIYVLK
nr:MAG TPA: hypothetical protein [Caudoviricetes sp.]